MAVQIVDSVMVGIYGGEDPIPLAAVSFATIAWALVFCFCIGFTMAMTPIIGRLFVNSSHKQCARYLSTGTLLYTLTGIVACVFMLLIAPLFKYMGQSAEVLDIALPYYRMMAFAMIPIMFFNTFRQFLEGLGNTAIAMRIVVFSNLLNVFFNWVLIFGHLGLPSLGVYGAGLATLLARMVCPLIVVLSMMLRKRYRIYLSFRIHTGFFYRSSHLLRIGFPIAMQMLFEMSAYTAICFMMGCFGAIPLAANQIADLMGNCAFMVSMSISSAATIVVSHMSGLGNWEQTRRAAQCSARLSLVWGTTVFFLFFILRGVVPRMFTQNEEVQELASIFLMLYGVYQISDALQTVMAGVLRALQDVSVIAHYAFLSYIVVNIPFAYLCAFVFEMGPKGLMMGYIVGLLLAAILYSLRVRRNLLRMSRF
ncbi:MAG: MATE family efflux transporter [Alistipes sp.]|nr:MATE family efflux transporter [Candidatus Alistipes equi]